MTLKIQFLAHPKRWEEYRAPLPRALADAGLAADLACDHPPETVDYIVYAPTQEPIDFTPYTRARAVLSLWAGVESIVTNSTLTQPLTRMVDQGLEDGMVEYVSAHVLRHHLGVRHRPDPKLSDWVFTPPPLARQRRVGILGLGALGQACARALVQIGFDVAGWSRTPKEIEHVTCLSGETGLADILARSEILVLLLPLTPQTEDLMNAATFAQMPRGAQIINAGRGALIDDAALIAALHSGQIGAATLDVFRTEPLPPSHPFWREARITITPHIAAQTRADTASALIARNIRRDQAGEPLLYLVDRTAGY